MIKVHIQASSTKGQFLEIQMEIPANNQSKIKINLPTWRPGRYELQHYAKNIRNLTAKNELGEDLLIQKTDKSSWEISSKESQIITLQYLYFANKLDAGSTFISDDLFYINFINCIFYSETFSESPYQIQLEHSFEQERCSLQNIDPKTWKSNDYLQLADSPYLASNQLQSINYEVSDKNFEVNIFGAEFNNQNLLKENFSAFSQEIINLFQEAPFENYAFNFIVPNTRFYHGVEHSKDTTIVLGPDYELNTYPFYQNILGISCHELFHAWNALAIRPKELQPYTFNQEPYFNTGYVIEGFTTYYGDYLLFRSNIISVNEYLEEINNIISRVYDNESFKSQSLLDSSMDLWLDGYGGGISHRRQSIYHHGALIALLLDITVRKTSQNQFSLDDIMRDLYHHFGKNKIGYSHEDILNIIQKYSNIDIRNLFNKFLSNTFPSVNETLEILSYLGISFETDNQNSFESEFGFKVQENIVTDIWSENMQLWKDDEIVSINHIKVENNIKNLIQSKQNNHLIIIRNKKLKEIQIHPLENPVFPRFKTFLIQDRNKEMNENFNKWINKPYFAD